MGQSCATCFQDSEQNYYKALLAEIYPTDVNESGGIMNFNHKKSLVELPPSAAAAAASTSSPQEPLGGGESDDPQQNQQQQQQQQQPLTFLQRLGSSDDLGDGSTPQLLQSQQRSSASSSSSPSLGRSQQRSSSSKRKSALQHIRFDVNRDSLCKLVEYVRQDPRRRAVNVCRKVIKILAQDIATLAGCEASSVVSQGAAAAVVSNKTTTTSSSGDEQHQQELQQQRAKEEEEATAAALRFPTPPRPPPPPPAATATMTAVTATSTDRDHNTSLAASATPMNQIARSQSSNNVNIGGCSSSGGLAGVAPSPISSSDADLDKRADAATERPATASGENSLENSLNPNSSNNNNNNHGNTTLSSSGSGGGADRVATPLPPPPTAPAPASQRRTKTTRFLLASPTQRQIGTANPSFFSSAIASGEISLERRLSLDRILCSTLILRELIEDATPDSVHFFVPPTLAASEMLMLDRGEVPLKIAGAELLAVLARQISVTMRRAQFGSFHEKPRRELAERVDFVEALQSMATHALGSPDIDALHGRYTALIALGDVSRCLGAWMPETRETLFTLLHVLNFWFRGPPAPELRAALAAIAATTASSSSSSVSALLGGGGSRRGSERGGGGVTRLSERDREYHLLRQTLRAACDQQVSDPPPIAPLTLDVTLRDWLMLRVMLHALASVAGGTTSQDVAEVAEAVVDFLSANHLWFAVAAGDGNAGGNGSAPSSNGARNYSDSYRPRPRSNSSRRSNNNRARGDDDYDEYDDDTESGTGTGAADSPTSFPSSSSPFFYSSSSISAPNLSPFSWVVTRAVTYALHSEHDMGHVFLSTMMNRLNAHNRLMHQSSNSSSHHHHGHHHHHETADGSSHSKSKQQQQRLPHLGIRDRIGILDALAEVISIVPMVGHRPVEVVQSCVRSLHTGRLPPRAPPRKPSLSSADSSGLLPSSAGPPAAATQQQQQPVRPPLPPPLPPSERVLALERQGIILPRSIALARAPIITTASRPAPPPPPPPPAARRPPPPAPPTPAADNNNNESSNSPAPPLDVHTQPPSPAHHHAADNHHQEENEGDGNDFDAEVAEEAQFDDDLHDLFREREQQSAVDAVTMVASRATQEKNWSALASIASIILSELRSLFPSGNESRRSGSPSAAAAAPVTSTTTATTTTMNFPLTASSSGSSSAVVSVPALAQRIVSNTIAATGAGTVAATAPASTTSRGGAPSIHQIKEQHRQQEDLPEDPTLPVTGTPLCSTMALWTVLMRIAPLLRYLPSLERRRLNFVRRVAAFFPVQPYACRCLALYLVGGGPASKPVGLNPHDPNRAVSIAVYQGAPLLSFDKLLFTEDEDNDNANNEQEFDDEDDDDDDEEGEQEEQDQKQPQQVRSSSVGSSSNTKQQVTTTAAAAAASAAAADDEIMEITNRSTTQTQFLERRSSSLILNSRTRRHHHHHNSRRRPKTDAATLEAILSDPFAANTPLGIATLCDLLKSFVSLGGWTHGGVRVALQFIEAAQRKMFEEQQEQLDHGEEEACVKISELANAWSFAAIACLHALGEAAKVQNIVTYALDLARRRQDADDMATQLMLRAPPMTASSPSSNSNNNSGLYPSEQQQQQQATSNFHQRTRSTAELQALLSLHTAPLVPPCFVAPALLPPKQQQQYSLSSSARSSNSSARSNNLNNSRPSLGRHNCGLLVVPGMEQDVLDDMQFSVGDIPGTICRETIAVYLIKGAANPASVDRLLWDFERVAAKRRQLERNKKRTTTRRSGAGTSTSKQTTPTAGPVSRQDSGGSYVSKGVGFNNNNDDEDEDYYGVNDTASPTAAGPPPIFLSPRAKTVMAADDSRAVAKLCGYLKRFATD